MEQRSLQEQIALEISKELEEAHIPCYVEGPPDSYEEWANIHVQTASPRSITLTLYKDQFIVAIFGISLSRRLKEVAEGRMTSDAYGCRGQEFRKDLADPDSLKWAVEMVESLALKNDGGRPLPVVVVMEIMEQHNRYLPSSIRLGKPYYV